MWRLLSVGMATVLSEVSFAPFCARPLNLQLLFSHVVVLQPCAEPSHQSRCKGELVFGQFNLRQTL